MGNVGTITKNGVEIDISFSTYTGQFSASVGEKSFSSGDWDELGKMLDKATKRVRRAVSVPFTAATETRTGGLSFRDGEATGLHSANGHVLVKWSDGQKEQLTHWNSGGTHYEPLSEAERLELAEITDRMNKARADLAGFRDKHDADLKALVIKAMDEASE